MGWVLQGLLGAVLVTPIYIAMGYFGKNFQVPGIIFLVWYFLGTTVAAFPFIKVFTPYNIMPSPMVMLGIVLIGFVLGPLSNYFSFSAVVAAPNAGLALALNSLSTVFSYLAVLYFSGKFPDKFNPTNFDWRVLVCILLVLVGASGIAFFSKVEDPAKKEATRTIIMVAEDGGVQ